MWLHWKTGLASFRGPRPAQSAVQPAPEPAPQPPQPGVAQVFQGAFVAVGTFGLAYEVAYHVTNRAAELKLKAEVQAIRHSADIYRVRADASIQAAQERAATYRVRADASIQAAQQSAAIDRVRAEQAKRPVDIGFHADYQAYRDSLQKDAEKKKDVDVKTDVDVDADKKEP